MAIYIPNATNPDEPTEERSAGSAAIELRKIKEQGKLTLQAPLEVPGANLVLPSIADRAGRILAFDAQGNVVTPFLLSELNQTVSQLATAGRSCAGLDIYWDPVNGGSSGSDGGEGGGSGEIVEVTEFVAGNANITFYNSLSGGAGFWSIGLSAVAQVDSPYPKPMARVTVFSDALPLATLEPKPGWSWISTGPNSAALSGSLVDFSRDSTDPVLQSLASSLGDGAEPGLTYYCYLVNSEPGPAPYYGLIFDITGIDIVFGGVGTVRVHMYFVNP